MPLTMICEIVTQNIHNVCIFLFLKQINQSTIFNSLYIETTQTPINCRMDKKKAVEYYHNSIFYTTEFTRIRQTTSNNMNESTSIRQSKMPNSKEDICKFHLYKIQ